MPLIDDYPRELMLFGGWLNRVFSDFYIVTDSATGKFHLVEHEPLTPNRKFLALIVHLYPDRDFHNISLSYGDAAFTFSFPDCDIVVQSYDDKIYHTKFVKEDNHG